MTDDPTGRIDAVKAALALCTFAELRKIGADLVTPLTTAPILDATVIYGSAHKPFIKVQPLQIADILSDWANDSLSGPLIEGADDDR